MERGKERGGEGVKRVDRRETSMREGGRDGGGRERKREEERGREGGEEERRQLAKMRELGTYSATESLSKFMRVSFTVLQSLKK